MEIRWKDTTGKIINVFDDEVKFYDNKETKSIPISEIHASIAEDLFSILDSNNSTIFEINYADFNLANKAKAYINGETINSPITHEDVKEQFKKAGVTDTFLTKKEIKELPKLLRLDETILYATSGMLDGNSWLIVCTNQRLLCLDKGLIYGIKVLEYQLEKINSVSYKIGLLLGELNIQHGSTSFTIKQIQKDTVKIMADHIKSAIEGYKNQNNTQSAIIKESTPTKSIVEQLKEYKELLDLGIITEEEFQEQKKKILNS